MHSIREKDVLSCEGWTTVRFPYRRTKDEKLDVFAAFGVRRNMTPGASETVSRLGVGLGSFGETSEVLAMLACGRVSESKIRSETLAGVEVGDHPEGRPGARPAQDPDVEEAVAEFAEYFGKVWRFLASEFKDGYGSRDESKCLYMNDTVVVTLLATTAIKCRSRNAADACRNNEAMAASMLCLSGQDWWPERERFTTACTGTLVYRTGGWDFEKVRIVNAKLVKRLVNAKFFENDRLFGTFYCLAVDAVHRDEKRNGRGGTCEGGDLLKADGKPRCGRMKWVNGVETNAPDKYAINVVWGEISFLNDLTKAGKRRKPYVGMFATNLTIVDIDAADEVFCWGRRRWNIENNFKVEKHDGFGLEHNFCNKARASRNFYLLMQIANNLWQVFYLGHLSRLKRRYRKVAQTEWVSIIREAFHSVASRRLTMSRGGICRAN